MARGGGGRGRDLTAANFPNPGFYGSHRLDRNNTRDNRLLSADPSSLGGKMRLGNQCLDLGYLADCKHLASDLLRNSRRSFVKYCADEQYGIDRDNDRSRSAKQYRVCVSLIGHGKAHKNINSCILKRGVDDINQYYVQEDRKRDCEILGRRHFRRT